MSTEYNGLQHFPLGNAQMHKQAQNLVITNIGSSGIDGFAVQLPDSENWEVNYEDINIQQDTAITVTYKGLDGLGRLKTIAEASTCFDVNRGQGGVCLNSRLLSEQIEITAYNDGQIVYQQTVNNPGFGGQGNWIWIVIGVIIVIKSDGHVAYSSEKGFDAEVTWKSPLGRIMIVPTGDEIDADEVKVKSNWQVPPDRESDVVVNLSEIEVTGFNLDTITITDETVS